MPEATAGDLVGARDECLGGQLGDADGKRGRTDLGAGRRVHEIDTAGGRSIGWVSGLDVGRQGYRLAVGRGTRRAVEGREAQVGRG